MIPGSLASLMIARAASSAVLADTMMEVSSPGTLCTAKLTINTDGTLSRSYTGTGASPLYSVGPSNWYSPSTGSIGSSYQVRFVPDGLSPGINTGTLADNTWTTISTAKTLICNNNATLGGSLEFRVLSSGVSFTSGAVSLIADNGL